MCGINTSVANFINDDTSPRDIPNEDDLWQFLMA
jgi:hypothetical protein